MLSTRTRPFTNDALLVNLVQLAKGAAGLVAARISIAAARLGVIGAPFAVPTVSWTCPGAVGRGGSSLSAGKERSKAATSEVLRTYTFPSAMAGMFQHLLVSG